MLDPCCSFDGGDPATDTVRIRTRSDGEIIPNFSSGFSQQGSAWPNKSGRGKLQINPLLLALLFHILRISGKLLHSGIVDNRHTILEHQGEGSFLLSRP